MIGEATIVVHTMGNPSGELGATLVPNMSPAPAMAPSMQMAGTWQVLVEIPFSLLQRS